MKKSKEFIILRSSFNSELYLSFANGVFTRDFCYQPFQKYYGIKLKPGEMKRIKITIEEVK